MLQFLLTSPNLKLTSKEGIISPLTEVRFIAVVALYACPLILVTLKSLTYILRHRLDKEPKSDILVSKGIMLPLTLIFVTLTSRIYAVLLVNCENVQLLD